MRKLTLMLVGVLAAGLLSLVLWSPARASERISNSVYSFTLTTVNTASSPKSEMMASSGDWVSMTGSGTFDTVARTIEASGSFTHYRASGVMACQGTWVATAFKGFRDFGMSSSGLEGGVLSFAVTHNCQTGGMTMTGIPMTVVSTAIVPVYCCYVEGSTVGPFTVPIGGTVVIRPQR